MSLLITAVVLFSVAYGQDTKPLTPDPKTAPTIKVVAPNGGEKWAEGSTQTIMWDLKSSKTPDSLKIRLVPKAGAKGGTAAKSMLLAAFVNEIPTKWEWAKAEPKGDDYKIEVTAYFPGAKKLVSVKDLSDKTFSITGPAGAPAGDVGGKSTESPNVLAPHPSLKVIAPNGGEKLIVGSTVKVKWVYQSPRQAEKPQQPAKPSSAVSFAISLSRDGGQTYPETIGNKITIEDREFDWVVSGPAAEKARIKVFILSDAVSDAAVDTSDGDFQIVSASEKPASEGQQH